MRIGTNYWENIEQTKEALDYAKQYGLNPSWGMPMPMPGVGANQPQTGGNNADE
jgi:hypothetical protein